MTQSILWLLFLFSAITWFKGITIASGVVASIVAGYLNEFHGVRVLFRIVAHGIRPSKIEVVLLVSAVLSSVVMVALGFGWALLLTTAAALLMDVLILRFR